jgi:hypothetical protein
VDVVLSIISALYLFALLFWAILTKSKKGAQIPKMSGTRVLDFRGGAIIGV